MKTCNKDCTSIGIFILATLPVAPINILVLCDIIKSIKKKT
jgi:hypothetical protein